MVIQLFKQEQTASQGIAIHTTSSAMRKKKLTTSSETNTKRGMEYKHQQLPLSGSRCKIMAYI